MARGLHSMRRYTPVNGHTDTLSDVELMECALEVDSLDATIRAEFEARICAWAARVDAKRFAS